MIIKETVEMPGFLPDTRTVHIYLPDDYRPSKQYDVLYMFDGHNLFYDSDATYGKSWGMKAYLDTHPQDLLVVGLECSHQGDERLNEYCPYTIQSPWSSGKITGKGKMTMDYLVHQLKPYIDNRFATRPDAAHTFIAGSSMGGLMSLYAAVRYPEIFSGAACLSPSFSICLPQLRQEIAIVKSLCSMLIYMDMGTLEMQEHMAETVDRMLTISHLLSEKGAVCYPRIVLGGGHNEASWERQIPVFLPFLRRRQM